MVLKFYVIEGDNGTGKDTLAAKFQNDGFEILTSKPGDKFYIPSNIRGFINFGDEK